MRSGGLGHAHGPVRHEPRRPCKHAQAKCLFAAGSEADRPCAPAGGGGLHPKVLRERHDEPLGGLFGQAKTGSLVRRPALWVGQDVDVAEYVRPSLAARARLAKAPRRRTTARAGFSTDPAIAARRGGWGGRDRRAADDNPGFDLIQDRVERPPSSPSAMPPPRSAAALRPPLSTAARNPAPRSRQRTLRPTLRGHSRVPETRVRVKLRGLDTSID